MVYIYTVIKTTENMDQVFVNFFEGSNLYRAVEVSPEGSVPKLFDAISKEFKKQRDYRYSSQTLWADIYNTVCGEKVHVYRVVEITSTMMEVAELTQGVGFQPAESPERWKHVTIYPQDLQVIQEL
jgi:hypothetical protein